MKTKEIQEQRIAIIGAGPGGLTLARILQKHGVKTVVYEREKSPTSRQQGGTLDLHENSGQWALKEAGLFEKFQTLARYEGEDFRLVDKSGKVYLDEVTDKNNGKRPEIDRGTLRELLLDSVDSTCIQWGHKLTHAVPLENGIHELHFENGHVDTVHLVIAADGAFSRIRPLVTDSVPEYTGLSMVELNIKNVATSHPSIAELNGHGTFFAIADHKSIFAQLNGNGNIRVYLSFKVDHNWLDTCEIPFNEPDKAKQQLLQYFNDWDESLKDYIRFADEAILPRRIYMLPIGLKWIHKPGVTLIGDAAHLMSPFAGKGANLAMRDAAELALSIVKHENVDQAVQGYEKKMYVYSSQSAEESDSNLKLCFSDNAAVKWMDLMKQYNDTI